MNKSSKLFYKVRYYFQIPKHISRFDLWINEIGLICHESAEFLADALEKAQTYYKLSKYYGFKDREYYYHKVIESIQAEITFRNELYYMDRSLYRRIYG